MFLDNQQELTEEVLSFCDEVKITGGRPQISFDVFDTLLHRDVHPDWVLISVASWLQQIAGSFGYDNSKNPMEVRHQAYCELADSSVSLGGDPEVSYQALCEKWVFLYVGEENETLAEKLADFELFAERSTISHNQAVYDCINKIKDLDCADIFFCLLYTSPSPRDKRQSRMPSSA